MFTGRQARAVVVTSALWGALHALFGAVLGAWFFFSLDHAPWAALPQGLLFSALQSLKPGVLAGLGFCILLRMFERSLTVETLSPARVVGWGILASLLPFAMMYGTLPLIFQGRPDDVPMLVLATVRSALVGGVAAAVTLAIARRTSSRRPPGEGHRPWVTRLLSSGVVSEIFRRRGQKSRVVEFVAIPRL